MTHGYKNPRRHTVYRPMCVTALARACRRDQSGRAVIHAFLLTDKTLSGRSGLLLPKLVHGPFWQDPRP